MAITDKERMDEPVLASSSGEGATEESTPAVDRPRDLQRTALLGLATIWLLDAVLQLQPFMFTKGSEGFSGMLHTMGANNAGWVSHTITWNASVVYHHAVLANTLFALVQFVIAFGIISRRTTKAALALSIVWSLAVWWFGEGLGGVLLGTASPFGGGPGAVLIYAVVAALLWPRQGDDAPFVAARAWGVGRAKVVWTAFWAVSALLAVVGHARQADTLQSLIPSDGQPGWLTSLDQHTSRFFQHHSAAAAFLLCAVCLLLAVAVYLPPRVAELVLTAGLVGVLAIWVLVQDLGGMLAGGATDPNAGPILALLILSYWPLDANLRAAARRLQVAR